MNRTFWMTLIVSATIGIIAILGQRARTRNLEQRLADAQARIAPEEIQVPVVPDPSDQALSEEKVDRVLGEIAGLEPQTSENDDPNRMQRARAKFFPDLLRSVQDLSVGELIALAGKMPQSNARYWVLLLAAEQDPLRVYQDEGLLTGVMRHNALEALGRKDPAAALRLLRPLEPRDPQDHSTRTVSMLEVWQLEEKVRCGTRLLAVDPDQGLQVLLEVHRNQGRIPMGTMGSLGMPSVPEEGIPGMIDAIGRPEYADLRDDLIEMTLTQTMVDGRVAAVAQRMESMRLSPEELNVSIDNMIRLGGMQAEPVAMLEWMAEVRPDKVPSAFVKWADRDMQASTGWLSEQEPSPMRDGAIARFAAEASELDAEAAAAWAREIQDEQLRKKTLRRIGDR